MWSAHDAVAAVRQAYPLDDWEMTAELEPGLYAWRVDAVQVRGIPYKEPFTLAFSVDLLGRVDTW